MSAKAAGAHQDKVIGRRIPRLDSKRLMRGRGRYIGDIVLPRMLHLAFVRSPYAHARILSLDLEAARACANVAAVFSGAELAKICKPLIGVASNRQGHKSAPQFPMAIDRVHWQGQPVVAVVAASRAEAEDAVQQVVVEWQELPAMVDAETAVSGAAAIHASLGDNLAFAHTISTGDPDKAFAEAALPAEAESSLRQFLGQTATFMMNRG